MIDKNCNYSLPLVLSFGCILSVCGCAGNQDEDTLLGYTRTAEYQYMLAMDEFEDEDCIEAGSMFTMIKKKYPYSKYAVLAELRSADCRYIMGNFSEAAASYQDFIKAHPTHEDAHYASYRRGLSFYKQAPSDFFIMPPSYERDLVAMRDARMALSSFLSSYKESSWRGKAMKLFGEIENALVRHEIYVARFYLSRNDRKAAVVRLEGIQNEYPKSTLVPDAMFMQAVTFMEMNEFSDAMRVFKSIIEHYPNHYQSKRAGDYLKHISQNSSSRERG